MQKSKIINRKQTIYIPYMNTANPHHASNQGRASWEMRVWAQELHALVYWLARWREKDQSPTKTALKYPTKELPQSRKLKRKDWVTLNRAKVKLRRTWRNLHKWCLAPSGECTCGHQSQAVEHILRQCDLGPKMTNLDFFMKMGWHWSVQKSGVIRYDDDYQRNSTDINHINGKCLFVCVFQIDNLNRRVNLKYFQVCRRLWHSSQLEWSKAYRHMEWTWPVIRTGWEKTIPTHQYKSSWMDKSWKRLDPLNIYVQRWLKVANPIWKLSLGYSLQHLLWLS